MAWLEPGWWRRWRERRAQRLWERRSAVRLLFGTDTYELVGDAWCLVPRSRRRR